MEKMQQLKLQGTVTKSNAMVRGKWSPESVLDARIVALVASKVSSQDTDFHRYSISLAELGADKNLSGKQYTEIKQSIKRLAKSVIEIKGEKRNFQMYTIFAACGYKDGQLFAEFHPDLKPHFLQLKEQFTSYNLYDFLSLPSTYSQQLFEILKSWSGLEKTVLSVKELHELLSTPRHMQKDFKDFRVRVLNKALEDITSNTDFRFEWRAIKKGRSIDSIEFVFSPHLIKVVAREKRNAKQEKQNRINNKNAKAAFACAKNKKECIAKDNKKAICELCEKLQFRNSKKLLEH